MPLATFKYTTQYLNHVVTTQDITSPGLSYFMAGSLHFLTSDSVLPCSCCLHSLRIGRPSRGVLLGLPAPAIAWDPRSFSWTPASSPQSRQHYKPWLPTPHKVPAAPLAVFKEEGVAWEENTGVTWAATPGSVCGATWWATA